jgi:carbon monoxide dehydrogenase subunit G
MPDVGYTTVVAAPVERVWDYVEDLNNWSHLMVGFQELKIVDDRQSIWTLRGDVGILSREVKIQVDITDWLPHDRVTFVVTGLTERLDGAGSFILQRLADGDSAEATATSDASPTGDGMPSSSRSPAARPGLLRRWRFAFARWILRRLSRKSVANRARSAAEVPSSSPSATHVTPVPAGGTAQRSRLEFQLRVSPLGPMAPMLELLMSPMLEPAAQDLADGIRKAVEQ